MRLARPRRWTPVALIAAAAGQGLLKRARKAGRSRRRSWAWQPASKGRRGRGGPRYREAKPPGELEEGRQGPEMQRGASNWTAG
eukprot:3408096-Alexandrium_andersonii.AAC.1